MRGSLTSTLSTMHPPKVWHTVLGLDGEEDGALCVMGYDGRLVIAGYTSGSLSAPDGEAGGHLLSRK